MKTRIKLTISLGRAVWIGPGEYIAEFLYLYPETIVAMTPVPVDDWIPNAHTLVYVENRIEPFKVVETPEQIDALSGGDPLHVVLLARAISIIESEWSDSPERAWECLNRVDTDDNGVEKKDSNIAFVKEKLSK